MTALLKMSNEIRNRAEALQDRVDEKGAVSIEYLAIALVVATLLIVVIGAAGSVSGVLQSGFTNAVNKIFTQG